MPVAGQIKQTRLVYDAGKIGHKLEQSLWQQIGTIKKNIGHAKRYRLYRSVGNEIEDCKMVLFQDVRWSVLRIWTTNNRPNFSDVKKQIAVSRSSAESEVISPDATEGIPALQVWDCVVEHIVTF